MAPHCIISIHINSNNNSFKLIQPWQIHSSKGQKRDWPLNHHLGRLTCSSHRPSTWATWLWCFCCYQIKWLDMRTTSKHWKTNSFSHQKMFFFESLVTQYSANMDYLGILPSRKVRFLHTTLERDAKLLTAGEMWLDLSELKLWCCIHSTTG